MTSRKWENRKALALESGCVDPELLLCGDPCAMCAPLTAPAQAATADLSLHNRTQALPNVAAAKSIHESLERRCGLSSSKRRPGRGEAWPARRCPGRSAGPGERRRGPLVAVLVGAFVSLLIAIAISLLDPLRHAQEIFCFPDGTLARILWRRLARVH